MRSIDWLSVYKICRPFFFYSYIAAGLLIKAVTVRKLRLESPLLWWTFSSTTAVVFAGIEVFPVLAALPAFALAALIGGREGTMSFFVAIPLVVSIAVVTAIIDAALIRLVAREPIDKRRFAVLVVANAAMVGIAIGYVLLFVVPRIQVIALKYIAPSSG